MLKHLLTAVWEDNEDVEWMSHFVPVPVTGERIISGYEMSEHSFLIDIGRI